MFLCACDVVGSQGGDLLVRLLLGRQDGHVDDETNPFAGLPGEVLEEMTPGERLAYLLHASEPVPDEVAARARQAYAGLDPDCRPR